MLTIDLLAPCSSAPLCCWSGQYRCFVARREQVQGQATHVLGNGRLASAWLTRPALGLDSRTPCCLLQNSKGFSQVRELLMRIEYGVYC